MDKLVKTKLLKLDVGRVSGLGSTSGAAVEGYKVVGSKPVGCKGPGPTVGPKPVVTRASLGHKDKAPAIGPKSLVGPKPKVSVMPGFKHSG